MYQEERGNIIKIYEIKTNPFVREWSIPTGLGIYDHIIKDDYVIEEEIWHRNYDLPAVIYLFHDIKLQYINGKHISD